MYDLISNLWLGMGVAVTPTNVMLCLIGAMVGTLIGVLPGIGSLATIAMLLPITFGLPPVGALIMLAGIYYGAQYGGSTTSILVFAATIRPLGLVIASFCCMVCCAAASEDVKWRETVVIAALVTAFCSVLFPYGLNLPFQLWPRFW